MTASVSLSRIIQMKAYRLSKSRMLDFLQCPKKLYLRTHCPGLEEISQSSEQKFSFGYQVGEVARQLYPDGIMIGHDDNLKLALEATQSSLKEHPDKPLFEATFECSGILVRADLMLPEGNKYCMVEVKASTGVKDYQLNDCAIQSWVVEGAGTPISTIELAHIDNTFIYQGDNNYHGLFKHVEVVDQIAPIKEQIPAWIDECQKLLNGDMPDIEPGSQCTSPYDCPYINYCDPNRNEGYPISILPRGGKLIEALTAEGIADVRDIPEGRLSKPQHERIRRSTINGMYEVDPEANEIMAGFSYPRFYLDFETIQFAVPIWKDTHPYQQIPFQWSCHIEENPGNFRHEEFLNISGDDPSWAFAMAMLTTLEDDGPIFVYSHFERTQIKVLAERYPDMSFHF